MLCLMPLQFCSEAELGLWGLGSHTEACTPPSSGSLWGLKAPPHHTGISLRGLQGPLSVVQSQLLQQEALYSLLTRVPLPSPPWGPGLTSPRLPFASLFQRVEAVLGPRLLQKQ